MTAWYHEHGRTVAYGFTAAVLLAFAALLFLGDIRSWPLTWEEPPRVEVCPELDARPGALDLVTAAYDSIAAVGHPAPASIRVGECIGDTPPGGIRWTVGPKVSGGEDGLASLTHVDGRIVSVDVVLDAAIEEFHESLYRHEAWHSMGAAHPWLPSSGHVLHPCATDPCRWGTSTRGYEP